jgi:hypothetical protein
MQVSQRHGDLVKESAWIGASVMVVDRRRSKSAADLRGGNPPGLMRDLDHGHEWTGGVGHQDPGRSASDAGRAGGSFVEQPCRPQPPHDLGGRSAAQAEPGGRFRTSDARVLMRAAQQRQSALGPHGAGELPRWSRHRSVLPPCRADLLVVTTDL